MPRKHLFAFILAALLTMLPGVAKVHADEQLKLDN